MEAFEAMGDSLHKKSPPQDEEEDVTIAFVRDARRRLLLNEESNELGQRSRGSEGYLISSQAELADALETSKRMIARIIGPAKANDRDVRIKDGGVYVGEMKLVGRSVFVGRIRALLDLAPLVSIRVPADRAQMLRRFAQLSEERWAVFRDRVLRDS
jgi:hypothetical protein